MGLYPHFILPLRSSRGFASTAPDLNALLRLAFASAPRQSRLTLPVTVSRRIIMQKARHHPGLRRRALTACRRMVSGSLSSPFGVLLIFRSRYWFAIGRQGVLSLAGWAPRIRTHFHVLGPTQVPASPSFPTYGSITLYGGPFQITSIGSDFDYAGPTTPPGRVRMV